ncbi:hypothetical protein F5879DRAFT_921857 [Lentinula edodes]|nr:hypothetical protein F5879DRAFT_921857 [Lentinula edodes]
MSIEHLGCVFSTPFVGRRDSTHVISSAPVLCFRDMRPDSRDDGDDNNMIQATWLRHKHTAKKGYRGLKEKLFSFAAGLNPRSCERLISTKPRERGAGEIATEIDEPALLTGYQCLCLTNVLLVRWRVYYPSLATLIRFISLQAICWLATHFTHSLLEHEKRRLIVWAVIGTTTCASRSVQIWVTSNLWWEYVNGGPGGPASANGNGNSNGGICGLSENEIDWQRWTGGKWGGRRWDWSDVVKKLYHGLGRTIEERVVSLLEVRSQVVARVVELLDSSYSSVLKL